MYNKAFSLLEISLVILISSLLLFSFFSSLELIKSSKLSKAINVTANTNFIENDNLVLWLETSNLSKTKESNEKLNKWQDLSKNAITFISSGAPIFKETKTFLGLKPIYFDGSSYFSSNSALNLSSYTAFIVAKPETNSSSNLYETGIVSKTSNFLDSKIVILKNNGSNKFYKKNNKTNFIIITNNDSLNSRPSTFYLGKDFKGEIFEIIIFDKTLSDKEILEIENYLYNKYEK